VGDDAEKVVNEEAEPAKPPSLLQNYVSFAGAAIVFASLASIILLILLEITTSTDSPYLGIFTYILIPGIMIFGLLVIFLGAVRERRRRRKIPDYHIAKFPLVDFNNPRTRRSFLIFVTLTFIFVFISAFGSYRAFEFSESVTFCGAVCHTVMKPEYTAFQVAPHSRLRCVDCHVGGGAEWYVRAKMAGVRQLVGVIRNNYSKPIKTPVHNMRPANETCAQCHWPDRFFGLQMKTFNHYAYDEKNTFRQTRLLINTGGGGTGSGPASGIHWHMNIANEITYVSSDEQRQTIPWVRMKDSSGTVTEYLAQGAQIKPQQIASAPKRTMDCIDCHNRPTHIYLPPDTAVNIALAAGKLDASLPYLKREAVAVLSKPYSTNDEALNSINSGIHEFYRSNYGDVYNQKGDSVKRAVVELQRIYQTYFFPEMKTDWQAHPNNIGHFYNQGCFRCHDGLHVSSAGKVIRNECNICHTTLDQKEGDAAFPSTDGTFRHAVDLGDLSKQSCAFCHKGNAGFQHPVNLGNISQFKCIDCHAGKIWSAPAG
jgi:hypothetical protein